LAARLITGRLFFCALEAGLKTKAAPTSGPELLRRDAGPADLSPDPTIEGYHSAEKSQRQLVRLRLAEFAACLAPELLRPSDR
jgi:hypothetical protein